MTIFQKISGYFKQFTAEVAGSQALQEEGRRDVAQADAPGAASAPDRAIQDGQVRQEHAASPHADAAPQFHVTREGSHNDGVSSAKPSVITGSEDATIHRDPPGTAAQKDWSVGYDENEPASDREGRS